MSTRRVNPSTFNCIRKEMDAKYDGKCSNTVCTSPIEVGDRIMFTNFQGNFHLDCYMRKDQQLPRNGFAWDYKKLTLEEVAQEELE